MTISTAIYSSILGLWRTWRIESGSMGVLYRHNTPIDLLAAGTHRFWDPRHELRLEIYDLKDPLWRFEQIDWLCTEHPEWLKDKVQLVETAVNEVAWIRYNGKIHDLLAPQTRQLYWHGYVKVTVERVDMNTNLEVSAKLMRELRNRGNTLPLSILSVDVPSYAQGVLTINNADIRLLSAGNYGFYRAGAETLAYVSVDLREQSLDISGQEILTADKVALRLNVGVTWKVSDVLTSHRQLVKPAEHLYREVQFALRQVVGTRSLDSLLEDKNSLDREVLAVVVDKLLTQGISITRVGVKDIILPGDMKAILTKVVEAEKAAMANVIRRREETAATRSLLNTAKVMEDNPVALRLKELETLEKITDKIGNISVYGGLEGVLNNLVKLKPSH